MEEGDDFGPLYCDVLKLCSPVKESHFCNDQNPNSSTSPDFFADVSKDLENYDGFLLSGCGVDGVEDDLTFDVETEQKNFEFDVEGLNVERKSDKMDVENEINVIEDLMEERNDDLELDTSIFKFCGNEEDSGSEDSLDILIEDCSFNEHNAGFDRKDVEKEDVDPLRNVDDPDDTDNFYVVVEEKEPGEIDEDDIYAGVGGQEPGEIYDDMKIDLRTHVEARVGYSDQSFHTVSKGVRSVFTSQAVHSVRNADYSHGGTTFRYLPVSFKKAFNIEDQYSGYEPWKRPGIELSDFFNFDLDEENWQNYCKQMKQLLLQTSVQSKAVGYRSELQSKNAPGEQIRKEIQVDISHGERVASLENNHQRVCDSDVIIEICFVDSPDDTQSFTKDLKDPALHEHKTRPPTVHKIVNGDKILPFPLDGSFHYISHEERSSHQVSIMRIDHPKEKREADGGHCRERVKNDKGMPLYYTKDVRKNTEVQTLVRNRLEDHHFHNSGEKSWRQGENKQSLKQLHEIKATANVYDNQEIADNGFDNCRMRIEETLSQADHQKENDDHKFNKGSPVDEDYAEQVTEPIDKHEQELPNNCNLPNKVENEVIFDDQKQEAKGEENMDEDSKKIQGSPEAKESYEDEMEELMSNIKDFIREIDELVDGHKHVNS